MYKRIFILIVAGMLTAVCAFSQTNTPWTTSGNIGIGTATPARTLDVFGQARATYLWAGQTGINLDGRLYITDSVGDTWIYFDARLGASSYVARGNFGLGTTSPRSRLDLGATLGVGNGAQFGDYLEINERENYDNASSIGWNALVAANNGTYKPAYAPGTGMVLTMAAGGVGDLEFSGINWANDPSPRSVTSFTPVMHLGANGNVGLGTHVPEGHFDCAFLPTPVTINGTNYYTNCQETMRDMPIASGVLDSGYRVGFRAENYFVGARFAGTLQSQMGLWSRVGTYAGAPGTIVNSYAAYLETLTSGGPINNAYGVYQTGVGTKNYFEGNVGIGTTNPTQKLSVNGTIRAKEVIVETTGWSDYVFADNYKLEPLSQVEMQIKEHRHLSGIPSSEEVAEKGIGLGEMQAKLLAKVEELTLHAIKQEKRIEQLEAEVQRLSK